MKKNQDSNQSDQAVTVKKVQKALNLMTEFDECKFKQDCKCLPGQSGNK